MSEDIWGGVGSLLLSVATEQNGKEQKVSKSDIKTTFSAVTPLQLLKRCPDVISCQINVFLLTWEQGDEEEEKMRHHQCLLQLLRIRLKSSEKPSSFMHSLKRVNEGVATPSSRWPSDFHSFHFRVVDSQTEQPTSCFNISVFCFKRDTKCWFCFEILVTFMY